MIGAFIFMAATIAMPVLVVVLVIALIDYRSFLDHSSTPNVVACRLAFSSTTRFCSAFKFSHYLVSGCFTFSFNWISLHFTCTVNTLELIDSMAIRESRCAFLK